MSRKPKNDIVAYYRENPEEIVKAAARVDLLSFARYMMPKMDVQPFHRKYYHVLNLFAHGKIKKLIVTIGPQHGKALPIDTPILTTKGWKKHGDLREGDYVFGDDGKPKKVLANFGSYKWHTKRINFADGISVVAAHEHLWKIYAEYNYPKIRQEQIVETQNIFSKKHRRSPYIKADTVISSGFRNLPIDPYILGLWLGDGLSRQGVIVSGKQDVAMYNNIGEIRYLKEGYYRILVEGLSRKLRICGLIGNKHIPMEYILSSKEQRLELLRGLMDTDGCVDTRGRCEFTQKENRLSEDVYILLRTLGIKATKHTYDAVLGERTVGKKIRITFTPDKGEKIFKLKRKQSRIDNKTLSDREDKRKFFIKSVEENEDTIVNCVQVEGGMYLAGVDLIPTHNSEGSSRKLPAFLLGLNPDLKVVIGSYATSFARDFNRDVQKIIDTKEYRELFPETRLAGAKKASGEGVYQRNSDVIDCVGHAGSLRVVGRGGPLTGKPVDIMILDDVYKDYMEANSPVVRESAWKWYTTVVKTRLHNNSQEIIVFTRWHNEDIVGKLEGEEKIIDIKSEADLNNIPEGAWVRINFEAIKTGEKTEFDQREKGESLWPQRHSIQTLIAKRNLDKVQFECLYQGNPASAEGRLYQPFKTYTNIEDYGKLLAKGNYTDVADKGTDFLCSICYDKRLNTDVRDDRGDFCIFLCVTDIIYTDAPIEETTQSVPMMLNRNGTEYAYIEANNGGRAFTKIIEPRTKTHIRDFTQTANKESRIITNAGLVTYHIIMPYGWETRFPKAYKDVTGFLRKFTANEHDDIEDVLSGMVEKEINGFSVSSAELQATEDYIDY